MEAAAAAVVVNGSSLETGGIYNGGYRTMEDYVFTDPNDTHRVNNASEDLFLLPFPTGPPGRRMYGPPNVMPSPIVIQLQHALSILQQYYKPSIIGIGLIGNTFAILVMAKSNLSKFSYVNYLIALYIADCCYLFNLLCLWLAENGVNIYKLGAWCHFVIFLSQSSSFLSLWCITSFFVDRFIGLQLQYWERSLCTTVKAKIIVIGFAVIAIAVFLNISLTVGVIIAPGPTIYCVPLPRFANSWKILDKIDIFINCMIPYLFAMGILVASVIGAHREGLLFCARRRRTVVGPHRTPQPIQIYDSDLEKGRTCLFLTYAFIHLLLNVPSKVIRLIQTFSMWSTTQVQMDQELLLWQQLFSNIGNARPAINVFILLFSYKGFRLAIKFLLIQLCKSFRKSCIKTCKNRNRRKNPVAVKKQQRRRKNKGFDRTISESDESDGADIALTEVKVTDDISSE